MLNPHIITTVDQKVLSFLAKFSDEEFYEREIARNLSISYGAANKALNKLFSTRAVIRRPEGRMYFYSVSHSNYALVEYKKLINLMLVEPLVEKLKSIANRIVLYGSAACGTDDSKSDLDLFVIAIKPEEATGIINAYRFPPGFESIRLQPVIKTPAELLNMGEIDNAYLEEVEQGIILWEKVAGELIADC